jgi:membrane protease YdiL (CAAX protease family)
MKWLTAVLPYLAVAIGLFWIQQAWAALLGFHIAIILSLLLAKSTIPVTTLCKSNDIRWVILNIFLCGSSGISLYFLWSYFRVVRDLPGYTESLGLTSLTWPLFIAYFVLVNPFLEEYFWRGYLGSSTWQLHPSDFLYAGFHGLILLGKMQAGTVFYSLGLLVLAGWFWRQLARVNGGLLAPVLGHMAADFTILIAVYQMVVAK